MDRAPACVLQHIAKYAGVTGAAAIACTGRGGRLAMADDRLWKALCSPLVLRDDLWKPPAVVRRPWKTIARRNRRVELSARAWEYGPDAVARRDDDERRFSDWIYMCIEQGRGSEIDQFYEQYGKRKCCRRHPRCDCSHDPATRFVQPNEAYPDAHVECRPVRAADHPRLLRMLGAKPAAVV